MPVFYVQTTAIKRANDGERFRGFIFETEEVKDVSDFADALSEGEMIAGNRLELWEHQGGTEITGRYPMAFGQNGVVSVSLYQKPMKEMRRAG